MSSTRIRNEIELEQRSIEYQRKQHHDDFYYQFSRYYCEVFHQLHNDLSIKRNQLSVSHLNYCNDVEKSVQDLLKD
ncbi:unnamed protein product [Rotaria sp. Silwood1]|nr:unnamed protein product [Rotaria sp. Silwood1]CAF1237415.1 unnamed protein product [Rotaria sp. Silwood1]CAF1240660.1 unnamed protein product [Rotaria sp. Silwood1]CAF3497200.1 unnamed protein product [Rotaria sp. Silwood1]